MTEAAGPAAMDTPQTLRTPEGAASARALPLHPFLFAAASVLALLARNLNQTTLIELLPALVAATLFALAAYLVTVALRRRWDAASAVIASIWVVGCLYYQDLFNRLNWWLDGGFPMVRSLPVVLVVLVLLSLLVARLRRGIVLVHALLTGIALVMFATPAWRIAAFEWQNRDARAIYDAERAAAELPQIAGGGAAAVTDRPPDIYHFVFDRYASEAVLEEHFGIEPGIGAFLEERGFYVASDSHSNYLKTAQSLASTFYMDYLDLLAEDEGLAGDNWRPVYEMLGDHRAARFLKARGYDFVQFGSWWAGTFHSPAADENHPRGLDEFTSHYFRRTALRPVMYLLPAPWLRDYLDWDYGQCQRVKWQIEAIKAAGGRERPVYVFAHILVPHDPYVFTPEGDCLTHREAAARGPEQGYIDQVAYARSIAEELVAALQAGDGPDPVILLQADEGPYPRRDYGIDWHHASPEELQIKTGMLNAYYFPDGTYDQLTPDITPVNSYRVMFNAVFGTDFPLLPDRIEAFANDHELYDFRDVTSIVRGGNGAEAGPAIP